MQSTGQASTQAVSFVPMQGSAMTKAICHLPLSESTLCLPERRFKRRRGKLLAYGADDGKDFRGDSPGCEHDGGGGVLQRCSGHGASLWRSEDGFLFPSCSRRTI